MTDEAGFDLLELHMAHGYLLASFISPLTNKRTDEYGGSLENRARLLLQIVAAVREEIGRELALGVRLCGDELIEGGTTIDDAVDVARMVEEQGMTDYLNTSIGVATASLYMIEASMQVPPGYALFIPSALRKAVDLPVVGVGRFKDPLQAERALVEGHCDLVGVVRGQIADADFAAKARAGLADDIRLCLSCNQECVGRMGLNRWLGCIENPVTGREAERDGGGGVTSASTPRKVVVVGGGPAGLQAASTAAARGHHVVLFESSDQLGGQARIAASVPSRAEFGDIVRNLVHACKLANVDVRLGVGANVDIVMAERPDAVVIATGAEPARPYWAPGDAHTVVDVRDVLEDRARPEGHVVVIDELGFHQATSVAELLADRGCRVEVITPGMVVGQDLGVTLDLEHWNVRAAAKGIAQRTDLVPMGWSPGTLTLLHHPTGQNVDVACDWVVLAVPQQPVEWLYRELREMDGVEVHRIGDCVAPRRAHAAVIEGARVGAAL
jgi:2,4-dienoyl-CoA reductase (NADPH2)